MTLPGKSIGENKHTHNINVSKIVNKSYVRIDATREDGRLGRLIDHNNDCNNPNLVPKIFMENKKPHLLLIATRDIRPGKKFNSNF